MIRDERFHRNQGVLSPAVIAQLADVHVMIAGVGGSGGQVAVDLARIGIGYLTLADFDVYELHNMNRQVGCYESTLGQPKIDVVSRMCSDINPELKIRKVPEGVTAENCRELVTASAFPAPDFVLEVMDMSAVSAKICLHDACRERNITAMTGIMLGFGASLIVFAPDAPSFRRLYVHPDGRLDLSSMLPPRMGSYFVKEFVDACLEGRGHAPTCVIGATTAAAMMVAEIMRGLLLGKPAMTTWPQYLYVDFFDRVSVCDTFPSAKVRS